MELNLTGKLDRLNNKNVNFPILLSSNNGPTTQPLQLETTWPIFIFK